MPTLHSHVTQGIVSRLELPCHRSGRGGGGTAYGSSRIIQSRVFLHQEPSLRVHCEQSELFGTGAIRHDHEFLYREAAWKSVFAHPCLQQGVVNEYSGGLRFVIQGNRDIVFVVKEYASCSGYRVLVEVHVVELRLYGATQRNGFALYL